MDFYSAYAQGFARVAACTVPVHLADPAANAAEVIEQAQACHEDGVAVAVFPELGLTGYSVDDLFLQDALLDGVLAAIQQVVEASADLMSVLVVGAPLAWRSRVYNCAVVICRGEVLGVAPKSYLPNYREFYERRWFAPGDDMAGEWIELGGETVPFGPDLVFTAYDVPGLSLHVEVCEDMWVPVPPSARAALAGATVLANISGSPITVGRAEDRRLLVRSASARCAAAYVYAAAGQGESTTDLSWDGQTMVYECGDLLGESERFPDGPRRTVVDVDLDRLRQERLRQGSFDDNRRTHDTADDFREVEFALAPPAGDIGLRRKVDRFPFVPDDPARLELDCYEAYNIQVSGLEQRLAAIGTPEGRHRRQRRPRLDARADRRVQGDGPARPARAATCSPSRCPASRPARPPRRTPPGSPRRSASPSRSSTSGRRPSRCWQDMGHPYAEGEKVYDVTFENVQAGLRYDYLFRLANQRGGIVVGTGDLSELALGWCTYGVGDQMSHYTVNAGVPKTLVQHLIRWVISHGELEEANEVLGEILTQEITPELIPTEDGKKPQATEDTVGPYNLQDFTLALVVRHGFRPRKIAFLAWHAWKDVEAGEWPPGFPADARVAYTLAEIRTWLEVFVKRFFANQFKRSALPNGPKVSASGTMSPRGDWRMPSDAKGTAWLAEIERDVPEA